MSLASCQAGHAHPDEILGQHLGVLVVGRMGPDDLLAQAARGTGRAVVGSKLNSWVLTRSEQAAISDAVEPLLGIDGSWIAATPSGRTDTRG